MAKYRTPAEMRDVYQRIVEASAAGMTIDEQATALGLSVSQTYTYRRRAREAGFDIADAPQPQRGSAARTRLAQLEDEMQESCGRCGLHGAHECLPARCSA